VRMNIRLRLDKFATKESWSFTESIRRPLRGLSGAH
jgi:hypothetical protein